LGDRTTPPRLGPVETQVQARDTADEALAFVEDLGLHRLDPSGPQHAAPCWPLGRARGILSPAAAKTAP
jgi:hypothetical protein